MKVHPIGFVEYKFDDDGNKRVIGPFCESEEAEESEKWAVRILLTCVSIARMGMLSKLFLYRTVVRRKRSKYEMISI